jgi:signal peptidase I
MTLTPDSKVQSLSEEERLAATTVGDPPSRLAGGGVASRPRPATYHSRRGDYRLRGLDLPVEDPEESPRRRSWRDAPRRNRRRRFILKCGVVLIIAAGVTLLLRATVIQPFFVPTSAMSPTLKAGDRILVTKWSFLAGSIDKGNIVVFQRPRYFPCSTSGQNATDLVQRVIATPGETIWSSGNTIYVNGRALSERGWYNPKAAQVGVTPIHSMTIPSGSYFVMNDNRTDACDSRSFGVIPKSSIIGKVTAVVFRNGHSWFHFF